METERAETISVLPYVLIVFGVRLVAGGATVAYSLKTGQQSPLGATPIHIGAVGVAMLRYAKVVARQMSRSEMLRFSIGNVFVDVLLSVGGALAYMSIAARAFTWTSFETDFLGLSGGQSATLIVAISLLVGSAEAFVVCAGFSWMFTRKLPKHSEPQGAAK